MDQRNLILAFALSMVVLLGWGVVFPPPPSVEKPELVKVETDPSLIGEEVSLSEVRSEGEEVLIDSTPTIVVESTAIEGEVIRVANNVLGVDVNDKGWLVGSQLFNYKVELGGDVPVSVLGGKKPREMYISTGIRGEKNIPAFSLVSNTRDELGAKLVLQTTLSGNRIWIRTLILEKDSYLIDVEDRIENGVGTKLYRQVVERFPVRDDSNFYEYTGPIGLINEELQEVAYDDLDEESLRDFRTATGGWTGIMDRYFIAAVFADQKQNYRYYYTGDGRLYRAGMHDDGVTEGGASVFKSKVYIGPKSIDIMTQAEVKLERSVDFGWMAVVSKPLHDALTWLYKYIPNYGYCIILLVLGIKIIFFYPTQKSYQSMAGMRKLQPEQKALQERYKDDRQKLGQEMMGLYKKNKVNPLGGCLPILIQIPVFFALYKVLLMSIEMRHAPFMGWITDLSVQDPFFILPLLMGISMYIQQKLNPQPPDPMQAKIMSFLPVVFTVMFLFFPAGLVLYWVVNNVLAIIQQRLVMKNMGVD